MRRIYEDDPDEWLLPWAILPEVDYLIGNELGPRARETFLADLADAAFNIEHGTDRDLVRAAQIDREYRALHLGLVDGVVMALAPLPPSTCGTSAPSILPARPASFRAIRSSRNDDVLFAI